MPFNCCVPLCRGNYPGEPKVSTFSFPSDEETRNKWMNAIKRRDFVPRKSSKVCEKHFQQHEIERQTSFIVEATGELLTAPLKHPRLIKGAIPSVLPGAPKYLSKATPSHRMDPEARNQMKENESIRRAIAESISSASSYQQEQSITCMEDVWMKFTNRPLPSWNVTKCPEHILFLHILEYPYPSVDCVVSINSEFNMKFYYQSIEMKDIANKGKLKFPVQVNSVNQVEEILTQILEFSSKTNDEKHIEELFSLVSNILSSLSEKIGEDKKQAVEFIREQINLMSVNKKNAQRYSWELLLCCSLLHSISPHAYKFLRNCNTLFLPCTKTLKNVCGNFRTNPHLEQSDDYFLQYVASKFKYLEENDKIVVLMLDEIHLKPYLDYKGGNVIGSASNSVDLATGAHVFMVNSLKSSYKEVVHILPVKRVDAEHLHAILRKVIIKLEEIGFEVCIVVTDNNAINRKAVSYFTNPPEFKNRYVHPKDQSRPLFHVIDSVHILKNFRNNWINQKPSQDMIFPDFELGIPTRIASFDALKQLHAKEQNQLLKYGYSLTLKALYPTSIERQNVKLALQIFCQSTVTALREFGSKINISNSEDTAIYIKLITSWWDIVNVKTMFKGKRLLNNLQEPITNNSLEITEFLRKFLQWLNNWQRNNDKGKGKLTKETHLAVAHTTDAFLQICEYLISEKHFNFVLLGKIQTDRLEERFGKYRYLSGSQYHVSLRQIMESENKLRLMSVVPLVIDSKSGEKISRQDIISFIEGDIPDHEIIIPPILRRAALKVSENFLEDIPENIWPSLVYISGYCSYSLLKKIKCNYCQVFLTEQDQETPVNSTLITANDRGGLCYPSESVSNIVALTYVIFENLLKDEEHFLVQLDQRSILINLAIEAISELDVFLGFICREHIVQDLIKSIIKSTANVLLKNYTKRRNDSTTTKTNMPQLKRYKPHVNTQGVA